MSKVKIALGYPQLASLLQEVANERNIEIKGYPIKINDLNISGNDGLLKITGEIVSKWNAFFDLSSRPNLIPTENKIELNDLSLNLDASNFFFKGILKILRGTAQKRLEQLADKPLTEHLSNIRDMLDTQLNKAPLPYNLGLDSNTKELKLEILDIKDDKLVIGIDLDQNLNITFKD